MDNNYLPLFITEEIYLVKVDANQYASTEPEKANVVEEPQQAPKPATAKVDKPAPAPTPKISIPKKETAVTHELAIWCPPLTKEDRDLLSKILMAIKKDMNKAHVMEGIASYTPHYKSLLCFGYDKELELKIGNKVALYEPTDHAGQKILTSVSPSDLQTDPTQKKRLWEALQKMFL